MPRVLVVGCFGERSSLEGCYDRAFREAGAGAVETLDLDRFRTRASGGGVWGRFSGRIAGAISERRIVRAVQHFYQTQRNAYDLIAVIKGRELTMALLEAGRRSQAGSVWVNINPDDPFGSIHSGTSSLNILEAIPFFDVYYTWSRALVPRLLEAGSRRAVYLPFGYDPILHWTPKEGFPSPSREVCFVGTWDRERESLLEPLAGYDLRISGGRWESLRRGSPLREKVVSGPIAGERLCEAISRAGVSLNLLRPQNRGSHNMRTLEIPAIGGLMLTTRSAEQAEFFPENEACLMFDGVEEFRAKVDEALAGGPAMARIREEGRRRVAGHSYANRARRVLADVEAMRQSR